MARTQSTIFVVLLFVLAALGVGRIQPRLARAAHAAKLRDDVYVLPPPNETRALALGYTAVAADLLWAKLVVEYGVHMSERREFHPDPYLDSIIALEPTFPLVYRFADTILCYRPIRGDEADARKARAILERGTRERPGDPDVWNEYGQFVAFIGPSFLPTETEKQAWRKDGAIALSHAVMVGADPEKSLAAATMLDDQGEREASIRVVTGAIAMTDDPKIRDLLQAKLDRLGAGATSDARNKADAFFIGRWRPDSAFVPRGIFKLLGPVSDPFRCTGPASSREKACARSWDEAEAAGE